MMLKLLAHRLVGRFGRRYGYDVGYMDEMIEEDFAGFRRFAKLAGLSSYGYRLPPGPLFAAKFIATRAAGCGPCVDLVIRMAEEAGVSRAALSAIARKGGLADPDMRLAADFAEAVVTNDAALPDLLEAVEARFGRRGRTGLAVAIATSQFYPMVKRGMGHARDCAMLPPEFCPAQAA
ncbi:hypothetical protein OU426_07790 [Frigidibacter sp. RF13]|nr:hypothetical protein [Frigidibacter sp. RF13]